MAGAVFELDGSAAPGPLAASLGSIEVRQELNAPSLALITFLDPPPEAVGSLAMGVTLRLRAPDGRLLFDGEITAIKRTLNGARERSLAVRAYDRLHRLRKRQSLRQLNDVGVSEFASMVAGDLGLSVDATNAPGARRVVIQQNQSDFGLLSQLAADAGLCFWLNGDTLRLLSLGGDGGDEVRLVAGETILEIVTDVTAEPMRKASHSLGWDLSSNHVLTGAAGSAAQDALEMRLDAVSAFEGLGERFLVNRICESDDDVRRLAQADIDRATARGLVVDALCEGDPGLHPGTVVRLEKVGSETDGPFVVSSATHSISAESGYTTRIGTGPPEETRQAPPGVAVTLGVVVDTDDPETRSRVKTRLPLFGDVVGDWMPVLSVGAGRSKGFAVIPEPDDEVLVLLPDGDPGRGIVLGGLYGMNSAAGERPAEGARAFVLRSPSGSQLTLDANRTLMRLESGDGDVLEIGPDGTLFRAMRDMTIEAPGHNVKIRAARVDFERA